MTASGGDYSPGIGGCQSSTRGTVIINGGKVTAAGGENGAGIGCGYFGTNANIDINGGEMTANGGDHAAGIGAYRVEEGVRLTVNGGTIIANGGRDGGSGVVCGTVSIQGGDVTAIGYKDSVSGSEARAFDTRNMSFANNCLVYINGTPTPLQDRHDYQPECTGNRVAHIVCGGRLPNVPQTGDAAHPALWSILAVFSLAGILIIAGRRKRAK